MRLVTLSARNLTYYWRNNLAVVFGVATAVAVLCGALLVGDSVRGSLRDLFVGRLGNTDFVIGSSSFFNEALVDSIQSDSRFSSSFAGICPLFAVTGVVADERSGRRASQVQVYGIDSRFWKFHGQDDLAAPGDRDVLLSPDLAGELETASGQAILLRIEKPSAIPAGSLHGRKDDLGRTIRLTVRQVLEARTLGDFSLRPGQGPVRSVFVSLARLQKDLEQLGKANTILFSEKPDTTKNIPVARPELISKIVKDVYKLDDLGIKLRMLDQARGIALESDSAMISDTLLTEAQAIAAKQGARVVQILSYLANSIRSGDREVPYSLVTAVDAEWLKTRDSESNNENTSSDPRNTVSTSPPIWLNDWAANDLAVHNGDPITLDYYVWKDEGNLESRSAQFRLAGVVPLAEQADRDYVPDYPGITTTENISDWDPPFPVDLKRVRPRDEDYWHKYKTTPKAFMKLEDGQRLWQSRFGKLTSLRFVAPSDRDPKSLLDALANDLHQALDPTEHGFTINPVRVEGVEASRGATDFGEYFTYFSFFLVAGALLLASLFFKLGIEQRIREIGTLRAIGYSNSVLRRVFVGEGVVLAVSGSIIGIFGAIGYGELMMYGLRTWWVGAVGTTNLTLHVSTISLVSGAIGGIVISLACITWTLRGLRRSSTRGLMTGSLDAAKRSRPGRRLSAFEMSAALLCFMLALFLLIAAWSNSIGQTMGFFGAGTLLLSSLLFYEHGWLSGRTKRVIQGLGIWPVSRLGFRNATYRPGRSILCITLIAAASFIIVAVDAFKRDDKNAATDKKSGGGGFPLIADSQLPIYHDPNTDSGREALNLFARNGFDPSSVRFTKFRVRPGDDASCLNLYQPRNPRIIGATDEFIHEGRFSFSDSAAQTHEEKANPWLLLDRSLESGVIPVIADSNSITYVLHRRLGDELIVTQTGGEPVRLRLVAALEDSIFQGELLMSEANFLKLFPDRGGYSFFLLEGDPGAIASASSVLEEELADFGFDAMPAAEKLASFHRVENTYLSTFQTLGGLGLVLGTFGLATVLLRNVLERRRELALLRAVGYGRGHFALMVITENAFLVSCGLISGTLCALVAIAPALLSRGGQVPALSLWLLGMVFAVGLLASIAATAAALRSPLLESLRAE